MEARWLCKRATVAAGADFDAAGVSDGVDAVIGGAWWYL